MASAGGADSQGALSYRAPLSGVLGSIDVSYQGSLKRSGVRSAEYSLAGRSHDGSQAESHELRLGGAASSSLEEG